MAKKKDLQQTVEKQLADMLEDKSEPSEGRMKLLALGIKLIAVKAKLEESDYGGFFGDDDGDTSGISERKEKPATGKRKNGSSDISGLT